MGSNSCAIKLKINMTMPANIPAKKMRVLMGKLQRRNYKFERRKPAILMLALGDASRHSRSSLSLTNSMKTPVLSLITVLTVAAFLGCQSQKKEETARGRDENVALFRSIDQVHRVLQTRATAADHGKTERAVWISLPLEQRCQLICRLVRDPDQALVADLVIRSRCFSTHAL